MCFLTRGLRNIYPSLIITAGIVARQVVYQHKALALHTSAKDQILQRVIEFILDGIHLLLSNGGIEDGLLTITMHEGQCTVGSYDTIMMGLQTLGSRKLITALKSLALGHRDILHPPILVGDSHIQLLPFALHINMDDGLFNISPQLDADNTIRHLDIALVQVQNLTETTHVDVR